jgi:hypothetical protein
MLLILQNILMVISLLMKKVCILILFWNMHLHNESLSHGPKKKDGREGAIFKLIYGFVDFYFGEFRNKKYLEFLELLEKIGSTSDVQCTYKKLAKK